MDNKTKELLLLLRNHPQSEPSLSFKNQLKRELRQRAEKVERKKRYIKIGNYISITMVSLLLFIWLVTPLGNELVKSKLNSLLGNAPPNYGDVNENDNYLEQPEREEVEEEGKQLPTFPESIELPYNEIEWETLQQDDQLDLVKLDHQTLGSINDQEITIELYAGIGDIETVYGVLTYNTEHFLIHNIGYAHDLESIEIEDIQSSYGEDGFIYLVGVVGSHTLGYQSIFYDESETTWYSYHHWGKPTLIDIQGKKEGMMQFEGKGLHPPNVSILSWHEGNFVVSDVASTFQQQISTKDENMLISSSYRKQDDSVFIDISFFHESTVYEGTYLFRNGKLIKNNEYE